MPQAVGLLVLGIIQAAGVPGATVFGGFGIAGITVASVIGTAVIIGPPVGETMYLSGRAPAVAP